MALNPYANLVKMLNAITLLSQPAGTTIKALMERLEVSRRTVFRLLEALEGLGFPLVSEKSEFNGKKTYRLLDTFVQRLPNISLPGFSVYPTGSPLPSVSFLTVPAHSQILISTRHWPRFARRSTRSSSRTQTPTRRIQAHCCRG